MRIVSLVPSITELLYAFKGPHQVVGVTRFCLPPKGLATLPQIIGGTKQLDLDKIDALQPDLIIANKEENDKDQINYLQTQHRVWLTDIIDVDDAIQMIETLGHHLNAKEQAFEITQKIKSDFERIRPIQKTCLYLIWNHPIMVAGSGTYIHAMLQTAGFINSAEHLVRYPVITEDDINDLNPDYILLSSEPYAFRTHHVTYYTNLFPGSKTILVDGQMFSWYGTKMLEFASYIQALQLS